MADMRKVRVMPVDSEDYWSWVNFDRVLYIEECGKIEGMTVAILSLDNKDSFRIRSGNWGKTYGNRTKRNARL